MTKVAVAMSGGVDSAVAAFLLKMQGCELLAVTLWLNEEGRAGEINRQAIKDARAISDQLGIEHRVLDCRRVFRDEIILPFAEAYCAGRTPNPCVCCNPRIKFGDLLDYALQHGCEYMATGHYVSVLYDMMLQRYRLFTSGNEKDQSYALCRLRQEQLSHVLFPLNQFNSKADVRKLATEAGLLSATKTDSQDICFVPGGDYAELISGLKKSGSKNGNFIGPNGEPLGPHKGIMHYTVGQRRGLHVALGYRVFVSRIDPLSGDVYLSRDQDLYGRELTAEKANWIPFDRLNKPRRMEARIRYHAKPASALVEPIPAQEGCLRVRFDVAQRAITPGQTIAFYDQDELLGGAFIVTNNKPEDKGE